MTRGATVWWSLLLVVVVAVAQIVPGPLFAQGAEAEGSEGEGASADSGGAGASESGQGEADASSGSSGPGGEGAEAESEAESEAADAEASDVEAAEAEADEEGFDAGTGEEASEGDDDGGFFETAMDAVAGFFEGLASTAQQAFGGLFASGDEVALEQEAEPGKVDVGAVYTECGPALMDATEGKITNQEAMDVCAGTVGGYDYGRPSRDYSNDPNGLE